MDPRASAMLSLKVFQSASLPHQFLGGVSMQMETLVDMCKNSIEGRLSMRNIYPQTFENITLKLQPPPPETEISRRGLSSIVIDLEENMVCAHFLYLYLRGVMKLFSPMMWLLCWKW
jgi:hypothetical protein